MWPGFIFSEENEDRLFQVLPVQFAVFQIGCDPFQMLEKLALGTGQILFFDSHQDSGVKRDAILDMPRDLEGILAKLSQGLDDFPVDADEELVVAALYDGCVEFFIQQAHLFSVVIAGRIDRSAMDVFQTLQFFRSIAVNGQALRRLHP